jgi:protoporphyrinogen oxidase
MTIKSSTQKESIAVIGGGMTGIAAALALAESRRFEVTLFEKEGHLGGMSSFYQWNDVTWDRFYHVVLSTDTVMLDFIRRIGIAHKIFAVSTKSGFFGNNRLVSLSTSLDFLKFPFLTLFQKLRLGLGIIYSSKIKDTSRLDKIYVRQWLTTVFGRRIYENLWEPLLRSKLGNAREKTSAAFIWATIARLYGTRKGSSKQEKMGHVHGGYYTILKAAEEKLVEHGVRIKKNASVRKIIPTNKREDNQPFAIHLNGSAGEGHNSPDHRLSFDRVLMTIDCPAIIDSVEGQPSSKYWKNIKSVNYLGVICVFLVLSRKLSDYYVINLLDKSLPFTGVIEATNVVDLKEVGNKHIVYLPKYATHDDPINDLDDAQIQLLFLEKLKKIFPDLKDEEVLHKRVFRERYVQPLQEINFLDKKSGMKTPVEGLYMVNTSMIYNSTLNNNAAITLAHQAANIIIEEAATIGSNS